MASMGKAQVEITISDDARAEITRLKEAIADLETQVARIAETTAEKVAKSFIESMTDELARRRSDLQ